MAKIKKIKEGTATVYPATIPQAVVDPTSGKSVRTELNEKEAAANKKQTVTNSATDYPSGAGVTASLALKTDISELNKIYPLYNYNVRVGLDSGLIKDLSHLTDLYRQNFSLLDSTVFLWNGEAGTKRRTSGSNTFASKLYNMANKVQQFGSELVTNGTFTTDTTGWAASGGATLSVDTARLKVTNTAGTNGGATQAITTVVGKTYHLTYVFTFGAGNGQVRVGTTLGGSQLLLSPVLSANATRTVSFVATGTTTYLFFGCDSSVATDYALFDNLSVKQMDWIEGTNDAVQTIEANQPYLGGLIAPNEVGKIKNLSTISNFNMQSGLSFSSNDKYSITFSLTPYITASIGRITRGTGSSQIRRNGASLEYINLQGLSTSFSDVFKPGINVLFTLVSTGSGVIILYVNGKFIASGAVETAFQIATILDVSSAIIGKLTHAQIHNRALSASEIQAQHDFLRLQIPEIEGIAIGNQFWPTSNYEGVVAGDGSVIPEVQESNNVNRIINGTFNGGLSPWVAGNANVVWQAGSGDGEVVINGTGTANALWQSGFLSIPSGAWVLLKYRVVSNTLNAGTLITGAFSGGEIITGAIPLTSTVGNHVRAIQATRAGSGLYLYLSSTSTSGSIIIDDVSFEVVGWSQSTALYDAIYAQTSGTAAQKELAALKAASMWSYYNNDVNNGAIYGKELNGYAIKLLALYPPTGYRVAFNADYSQLVTYLGGSSVAGAKLKALFGGFNNSNSTNESGFSAIAGGRRNSDGTFSAINLGVYIGTGDLFRLFLDASSKVTEISTYASDMGRGYYVRLLRNSPVGHNENTVTTGTSIHALGAGNLDIVIPFGYAVDSIKVISKTGITGLSAKYCSRNPATLAVTELDTLFTAKTVVADTAKVFSTNVDQTIQRQDAVVRINGTKADTTAEFEVRVNIKKVVL